MPMYEFECLECGNEFEALVLRSGEKDAVKCPSCDSPKLEDKISSFASGSNSGNCAPTGG